MGPSVHVTPGSGQMCKDAMLIFPSTLWRASVQSLLTCAQQGQEQSLPQPLQTHLLVAAYDMAMVFMGCAFHESVWANPSSLFRP